MTWTTPPTFSVGAVLTAGQMTILADDINFLRNGVAKLTSVTATQGPTVGTTELLLATAPAFVADGTTLVEIGYSWYNVSQTISTDIFFMRLYDGASVGSGTQLAEYLLPAAVVGAAGNGGGGYIRSVITPTAGSHTYTARIVRSGGTGTANVTASAVRVAAITIKQVN